MNLEFSAMRDAFQRCQESGATETVEVLNDRLKVFCIFDIETSVRWIIDTKSSHENQEEGHYSCSFTVSNIFFYDDDGEQTQGSEANLINEVADLFNEYYVL